LADCDEIKKELFEACLIKNWPLTDVRGQEIVSIQ